MLIGIDLGTTALKVAAFDPRTGKRLAGEERPLRVATGKDGRREQSPALILKALRSALSAIGGATGGLGKVRGIGLASQGGSGIVADRETGQARTPMVLWNDARAFPEHQRVAAAHPTRFWRTRTLRDEPGMGLARLAQLRAKSPALLHAGNCYAGAGDFLYFHLTGQWRQDACHALQTGCYDARKNALSGKLAAIAGLGTDFFPALRDGHQTFPLSAAAASRFGLPAGIPVAGPYMDHEAGFLSAAHVSERPLQCSMGTAWVGNFQLASTFDGHAAIQFSIPAPAADGRLVIQPLLTGNVTWDWALRHFVNASPKTALARQARILDEALLPPEGLTAVPWLNRPNPMDPGLLGGCSFVGAGPITERDDFLRAVVAGMGYELQRVFAEVAARGAIDSVVLSGGASQSRHFQALIAALFEPLPVHQLAEAAWMGTRGCLWAFEKRVARASAAPVKPDRWPDRNALASGRRLYGEVFDRLYRQDGAGAAYSVKTRERV